MRLKILFFLSLLGMSFYSFAFKLSPMSVTLSEKGKKATKSFRIVNTSKKEIKVEAEILARFIDKNNNETRKETTHFTLYPPQVAVEPGKSRVLRVSYIGEKVSSEKAYRLVVRQLPLKDKKKENGAQINFLFEYVASVYVAPKKAKARLELIKCLKVGDKLEIDFKNSGTKHSLLRRYDIVLSQKDKKRVISFKKKKFEKLGSQNILAGINRRITIADDVFDDGRVSLRFRKVK